MMKKMLSLLGAFVLSMSTTIVPITTTILSKKNIKQEESTWDILKNNINLVFDNFSLNSSETNVFLVNKNLQMDQNIINFAKESSFQYFEIMQFKNISLENTILFLANENPHLKEVFETEIIEMNLLLNSKIDEFTFKVENLISNSWFGIKDLDKLKKILYEIKFAKAISSTLAAAASIAAAGFWAAAWWFGITIPMAILATTIAGFIISLISLIMDNFIWQLEKTTSMLERNKESIIDTGYNTYSLLSDLKDIKIFIQTKILPAKNVLPFLDAFFSIIFAIDDWMVVFS